MKKSELISKYEHQLMGFILKRLLLDISVILLRKFSFKKLTSFLG